VLIKFSKVLELCVFLLFEPFTTWSGDLFQHDKHDEDVAEYWSNEDYPSYPSPVSYCIYFICL